MEYSLTYTLNDSVDDLKFYVYVSSRIVCETLESDTVPMRDSRRRGFGLSSPTLSGVSKIWNVRS